MASLSSSIIFKFYILITVIITALTIIVGYQYIDREKEFMLISQQNELKDAASELERSISRSDFAADMAIEAVNEEQKAVLLNAKYQPCINQVQKNYPDFGIGIYARDLDRIIALTGVDDDKLKKKKYDERYFKIYETSKIEIQQISTSVHYGTAPIINLQYPIIADGRLLGFTWASTKTEAIQAAWNQTVLRLSIYCFFLWLVSMLLVRLIFDRLFNAMNELIIQIKQDTTNAERFQAVPELIPLVKTIIERRCALEASYQKRAKFLAEAERANRLNLVGEMAAGVAHEIRNPMTSVQGFLQFAKKTATPKTVEYIDTALIELDHANQIIDDFLALARNRFVEKSPECINKIICRLEPMLYADCLKRGVSLCLNLKDVPLIFASKKEIKQLILNLTRNALDAMVKGGCLDIRTEYEDNFINLVISDTGKGIPADQIDSIFEPFFTTKTNGTGLGLVVCQSITEHHGGNIKIGSQVGTGTVFTVYLPPYQSK